ncbi:MAG: hypothetical protein QOH43_2634 [Solirubrobacteraceae bacterium]|nr:hypothetical protein [Solirubrobacteraceae bacterium]
MTRARRAVVLLATSAAVAGAPGVATDAAALPLRTVNVTVTTIPPTPKVKVAWQGSVLRTDARGRLQIPIVTGSRRTDRAFGAGMTERLRVLRTRVRTGVIAEFDRWRGTAGRGLQASLVLSYHVIPRFVDPHGDAVAPGDVDGVSFRSRSGVVRWEPGGGALWVPGTRVVAFGDHVAVKQVEYTVDDARVEGLSVVNRAQQRFLPSKVQRVRIGLLLHSVSFTVRDALFGFRTGKSVRVVQAGGRIRTTELRDGDSEVLRRLPRGTYDVRVQAAGMGSTRPLALSRDQQLELSVVSYLDIAVVGGALTLVALLLVIVGRPGLRRRAFGLGRRRRRAPATEGGAP